MSYRGAFQIGDSADLRAVFTDVGGDFMSADADPTVYFYDNSVDDAVRAAEVEAETFTSAIASVTASELSTGYYSATWTIAAEEGVVYEYWSATVDGATQTTVFTWTATAGATVANQSPGNNTMVIIEINGIEDTDENELVDQLFYTTVYNPLYGSPDMMRLELGQWISYIPDDTLALMLYWSSREADFIQVKTTGKTDRVKFARTKFVLYDAALRAMMIPGHGQTASTLQGGRKALGDLSIRLGSTLTNDDLEDVLTRLRAERQKWFKVLQAGACINPGQSFDPTYAVKGRFDPDRRNVGRLWEDPHEFFYPNPAVNQKRRRLGRRRARWGMYPGTRYSQDWD